MEIELSATLLSQAQIISIVGIALIMGTIINILVRRRYPDREPLIKFQRFRAWWLIVAGLTIAVILKIDPRWGPPPQLIGFCILSLLATRQFLKHVKTEPSLHTRIVCYASIFLQYYWIYIHWYGFFVVFIPVFLFLYLPVSSSSTTAGESAMLETASLHWVMMTTVFCLSHAAYLIILPGGRGLLFFVVLLTEIADLVRIILCQSESGRKVSPLVSCGAAIVVAWIVGPAFTPLSEEHILLAGLVLGVAGSIGHSNVYKLSQELGIERGGPLERMESMAYTAPIFLHGYRYFNYPFLE